MKKILLLCATLMSAIMLTSCGSETTEKNTVKDIDGNEYTYVRIGYQEWMVENLKVTHYNDGTPISYCPSDENWAAADTTGKGAWCVYDYAGTSDEAVTANSYVTYGALYNFHAVNSGKLAPEGWRVATEADWNALELVLQYNKMNYDNSATGNKVAKAMADNSLWTDNTDDGVGDIGTKTTYTAKNNASGFTALPAGDRRVSGEYVFQGEQTFWWTATAIEGNEVFAQVRSLSNTECDLIHYTSKAGYGFSVRCVRDITDEEVSE